MTKHNLKDILQGVVGKVDTAKQDAILTYTQQEYEAVKDTIPEGTLFNISDDKTEPSFVTSPFKFGIDDQGNYGYYKAGADTVTPF